MLSTIYIGVMIGVFVSAPVGPLGVLCIQRTINRGRLSGFMTGLGAAASDIIYAILVGFSMSYIVDFVEKQQYIIQVLGSIIVLFFGYRIFNSNPAKATQAYKERSHLPAKIDAGRYLRDFLTSFGLCISNPLIIFLFIGLFARFQIFNTEQHFLEQAIGVVSIIAGAILWWSSLTFFVSLFRDKFKERGLLVLNRITGGVIAGLGLIGIGSAIYQGINMFIV